MSVQLASRMVRESSPTIRWVNRLNTGQKNERAFSYTRSIHYHKYFAAVHVNLTNTNSRDVDALNDNTSVEIKSNEPAPKLEAYLVSTHHLRQNVCIDSRLSTLNSQITVFVRTNQRHLYLSVHIPVHIVADLCER